MTKRVLRRTVVINDQPHEIYDAPVLMFARGPSNKLPGLEALVDVWSEVPTPEDFPASDTPVGTMQVQVVGTGHPVPDDWTWLASTVDGRLVWHLYRLP